MPPSNPIEAVIPTEWLEVASWSQGKDGENVPCTQVHLLYKAGGIDAVFAMRFKSRAAIDNLIEALVEHRDYVWPDQVSLRGAAS